MANHQAARPGMATHQAVQTGPPKRLLCLDGGGIKGVSSLMILQAIMEEVKRLEDGSSAVVNSPKSGASGTHTHTSHDERRPVDYFDLTGGTSTGGIIAVMLSRLGMTCSEAIDVYKSISSSIFAVRVFGHNISEVPIIRGLCPIVLGFKTVFSSQFSSKYIDQNIAEILSKRDVRDQPHNSKGETYLVWDYQFGAHDAKGKMLMCATMADRGKAILFRNYTPPSDAIPETGQQEKDEPPAPSVDPYSKSEAPVNPYDKTRVHLHEFQYGNVTIREAVRATSAAPTYLPPEIIQKITFWDGGCLNNNPIDQIWAARYDLTPHANIEPYVQTVLSIGATYADIPNKIPTGPISRLARVLGASLGFMTNTEAKHLDFKRNIYRRNCRQPKNQITEYFRFNASVGNKPISLSDYKQIPFLIEKTKQYLKDPDTIKKIKAVAALLARVRR